MKALVWGNPQSPNVRCIVIFLHGRGSTPEQDLPPFESVFEAADGGSGRVAAVFLRAQDEAWYPEHWTQPRQAQEPYLSSALDLLHKTITELPIPPTKVILAGFSQGATISLCYALTHPDVELAHIYAMSGSIIGSPKDFPGAGFNKTTKIWLAWGSADRYFKQAKVDDDVAGLEQRGADVKLDVFPMGHYVAQPELDQLAQLIKDVLDRP